MKVKLIMLISLYMLRLVRVIETFKGTIAVLEYHTMCVGYVL